MNYARTLLFSIAAILTNLSCNSAITPEIQVADAKRFLSKNDTINIASLVMNHPEYEKDGNYLRIFVDDHDNIEVWTGYAMSSGHVFVVKKNKNTWEITDVNYWWE
ncbi:MAG: hypothetical protein AABZ06_05490 [Bdellovibrionota bacterium]